MKNHRVVSIRKSFAVHVRATELDSSRQLSLASPDRISRYAVDADVLTENGTRRVRAVARALQLLHGRNTITLSHSTTSEEKTVDHARIDGGLGSRRGHQRKHNKQKHGECVIGEWTQASTLLGEPNFSYSDASAGERRRCQRYRSSARAYENLVRQDEVFFVAGRVTLLVMTSANAFMRQMRNDIRDAIEETRQYFDERGNAGSDKHAVHNCKQAVGCLSYVSQQSAIKVPHEASIIEEDLCALQDEWDEMKHTLYSFKKSELTAFLYKVKTARTRG